MKTITIITIVTAMLLTLCLILSLVRNKRTAKERKWTNLILPTCILLLFVGLFVGAGISRHHLRKELTEMKESAAKCEDESHLTALEERNKNLSLIIGRDKELEKQIEALRFSE